MRIVSFRGGLGNQLYESCFFLYLKKKYPQERIFGYYPSDALQAHNGLEVEKWFDIKLPPCTWFSNIIGSILYFWNKLSKRLRIHSILTSSDKDINEKAIFYNGYWMDSRYYKAIKPIYFNTLFIDSVNRDLLDKINNSESIAVHVRRGDYLSNQFKDIYGGICTGEYYMKGVDIMQSHFKEPQFYFFSDDIEYVRNTFHLKSMTIVSHNTGKNSFFDLYLMSHCKGIIMANSSFSCWAAYLNQQKNNIVVCPSRMTNRAPLTEMLLDEWIKI